MLSILASPKHPQGARMRKPYNTLSKKPLEFGLKWAETEQKATLCLRRKGTWKLGYFHPCLAFEKQESVDFEWHGCWSFWGCSLVGWVCLFGCLVFCFFGFFWGNADFWKIMCCLKLLSPSALHFLKSFFCSIFWVKTWSQYFLSYFKSILSVFLK